MKYNFVFGYSYDYSLSSISTYSSGSHEVFLTYKIRCKKETTAPVEIISVIETPAPAPVVSPPPVTEPTPSKPTETPAEQPK